MWQKLNMISISLVVPSQLQCISFQLIEVFSPREKYKTTSKQIHESSVLHKSSQLEKSCKKMQLRVSISRDILLALALLIAVLLLYSGLVRDKITLFSHQQSGFNNCISGHHRPVVEGELDWLLPGYLVRRQLPLHRHLPLDRCHG